MIIKYPTCLFTVLCCSFLFVVVSCKQPTAEIKGKYRITNINNIMNDGVYSNWIVEFADNNVLITEYTLDSINYIQLGKWKNIDVENIEIAEAGRPNICRIIPLTEPHAFGFINQNKDTVKYQIFQSEKKFNASSILDKEWVTLNDSTVLGFDTIQVQPNYVNLNYEFKSNLTYKVFPYKDMNRPFDFNSDSTYILLNSRASTRDLIRINSITSDTLKFSRRDRRGEMKTYVCVSKTI